MWDRTGQEAYIPRVSWRVENFPWNKCLPLSRGKARLEPFYILPQEDHVESEEALTIGVLWITSSGLG